MLLDDICNQSHDPVVGGIVTVPRAFFDFICNDQVEFHKPIPENIKRILEDIWSRLDERAGRNE